MRITLCLLERGTTGRRSSFLRDDGRCRRCCGQFVKLPVRVRAFLGSRYWDGRRFRHINVRRLQGHGEYIIACISNFCCHRVCESRFVAHAQSPCRAGWSYARKRVAATYSGHLQHHETGLCHIAH